MLAPAPTPLRVLQLEVENPTRTNRQVIRNSFMVYSIGPEPQTGYGVHPYLIARSIATPNPGDLSVDRSLRKRELSRSGEPCEREGKRRGRTRISVWYLKASLSYDVGSSIPATP